MNGEKLLEELDYVLPLTSGAISNDKASTKQTPAQQFLNEFQVSETDAVNQKGFLPEIIQNFIICPLHICNSIGDLISLSSLLNPLPDNYIHHRRLPPIR